MILSISSNYFPRQYYLIGLNDEEDVSSHPETLKEKRSYWQSKAEALGGSTADLAVVQAVILSHDGLRKLRIMQTTCVP